MTTVTVPSPVLFADFTTEGTSNNYLYNGIQYLGLSAWLTAIGGTFSNATASRYFVNFSGLLATVGANVIRFDYDPVALTSKGILLEDAGSNIVLQSNTFSNASWSQLNVTSITQNAVGPDGVNNSAWTLTSAGGVCVLFQASLAPGVTNTHSYWVKAGTDSFAFIQTNNSTNFSAQWFNLSAGTVATTGGSGSGPTLSNPQIAQYANGWWRISVASDSTTVQTAIGVCDADNDRTSTTGRTLIIWGAQVEPLSLASSYIPTTTVAVSRSADSLTAVLAAALGPAVSSFCNVTQEGLPGTTVILGSINDNTTNNYFDAPARIDPTNFDGNVNVSGSSVSAFSGPAVTSGTEYIVASAAATGIYDGAVNGTLFTPSSQGSPATIASPHLGIGSFPSLGLSIFGWVKKFAVWNTNLSADQLTGVTTPGAVIIFAAAGPNVITTLTSVPAKTFTRKRYEDLLEEIREEVAEEREAIGDLDEKGLANRNFEIAQRMFHELESNLTPTNYAKMMDAREKLEAARKSRDHHYFMEIVNKEWAKHNG